MNNKRWSLVGVVTCLVAIGYLGGLFTTERYYIERTRYEECPDPWAKYLPEKPENYDPNDPLGIVCEQEQEDKGIKPTIYKDNCPDNYQGDDRLRACDTEQVFDPRGTLLVILIVALGWFVLSYRREEI